MFKPLQVIMAWEVCNMFVSMHIDDHQHGEAGFMACLKYDLLE